MRRTGALSKGIFAVTMILAVSSSVLTFGQMPTPGFPYDWSHRHVVFSNPGTLDDAERNGAYSKWSGIVNHPRYQIQQGYQSLSHRHWRGWDQRKPKALKTDWSMRLGSGATVGMGQYPAKYFFTTSSPSCSDWVAYNTGATGASGGQANIEAYTNLYQTT